MLVTAEGGRHNSGGAEKAGEALSVWNVFFPHPHPGKRKVGAGSCVVRAWNGENNAVLYRRPDPTRPARTEPDQTKFGPVQVRSGQGVSQSIPNCEEMNERRVRVRFSLALTYGLRSHGLLVDISPAATYSAQLTTRPSA